MPILPIPTTSAQAAPIRLIGIRTSVSDHHLLLPRHQIPTPCPLPPPLSFRIQISTTDPRRSPETSLAQSSTPITSGAAIAPNHRAGRRRKPIWVLRERGYEEAIEEQSSSDLNCRPSVHPLVGIDSTNSEPPYPSPTLYLAEPPSSSLFFPTSRAPPELHPISRSNCVMSFSSNDHRNIIR